MKKKIFFPSKFGLGIVYHNFSSAFTDSAERTFANAHLLHKSSFVQEVSTSTEGQATTDWNNCRNMTSGS